mmetsp:Transcript_58574/g.174398  ORF Transcript_58574/g.174398 Transcript_58574/m.174398 type:complete len:273 (-) Transcript_58574:181-999(-)
MAHSERLKCSFCGTNEAAVVLESLVKKPLCLVHYYTTRVVRMDPAKVRHMGDGSELRKQLPAVQSLFSEAFTDLKKDIAEESARAFAVSGSDPLAMLHDARRKPAMKSQVRRSAPVERHTDENEGGFMRDVALPERYLKQQMKQKEIQFSPKKAFSARKTSTAKSLLKVQSNPYKRRKQSKASIWNMALESPDTAAESEEQSLTRSSWESVERSMKPTAICSCGSKEVQTDGNVTGRAGDIAKGETWGNKDRSEVVVRYRCLRCGKAWNEEE